MDRIKYLNAMLAEEPEDPFLHYGLALEYVSSGDLESAREKFEFLLANHPAYVATYYQFALLLLNKGNEQRAIDILKDGIQSAELAKDRKTVSEMKELLYDLTDEDF